ncbi:hypothetical protein [Pectinatus frisingensis]|uniref:hypothetical protein n=1 Tax=Pectinatus frisingensis TaxID=865 RepID=UPI0018C700D2|nr:hypothetical protein [Pectinatus frisingensis]
MTYEEIYRKCKTVEELKKKVKRDIIAAVLFSPVREKTIKEALNIIVEEKHWETYFPKGSAK